MPPRSLPPDPDQVRMSFGDHLEELRSCMIRALLGVVVATLLCFQFGNHIIDLLTRPYLAAMRAEGFDPQLVQLDPTEAFLQYFKIAVQFGLVLSLPWVLYQVWRFVAVGLYPSERRLIRLFAPASVGLFLIGAAFTITVVLAGLLKFLISVASWFSVPGGVDAARWYAAPPQSPVSVTQPVARPLHVPVLDNDPPTPRSGDVWVHRGDRALRVVVGEQRFEVPLRPGDRRQLVQPLFSISDYMSFVTGMALAFGLGFQLPIVVIFLIAVGIVSSAQFAAARRFILLGIAILAAVITPSPDIPSMMMLALPMFLLFESGLWIGRLIERRRAIEAGPPLE